MSLFDPVFLTRITQKKKGKYIGRDRFAIINDSEYESLSLSADAEKASCEQYTRKGNRRVFFAFNPHSDVTVYIIDVNGVATPLDDENGEYEGYLFPCIGQIADPDAFDSKISSLTGNIVFLAKDNKGNEEKYNLTIYPSVDDDSYLQMVADILRIISCHRIR